MERKIEAYLKWWKGLGKEKMPLLLYGARQTGKTYILREFGAKQYINSVYLNFETELALKSLFNDSINPKKLLPKIEKYFDIIIVLALEYYRGGVLQTVPDMSVKAVVRYVKLTAFEPRESVLFLVPGEGVLPALGEPIDLISLSYPVCDRVFYRPGVHTFVIIDIFDECILAILV